MRFFVVRERHSTAMKMIYVGFLSVALIVASCLPAYASTLWGAAGSSVKGNGTLIAKNYDGKSTLIELRLVLPRKGSTYLGLFSLKNSKEQGPLAGVNEKGLAVVTAVPESLPPGPDAHPSIEQITEKLLAGFDTVDGILSDPKILRQGPPAFYVIADRSRIASVEIAPRGEITIKSLESGIFHHTNHYIDDKFLTWNKRIIKDSESRLERVGQLLRAIKSPLTMDNFIELGHDRGTSPEDGLLRVATPPGAPQTLATWILYIPGSAVPELHVGLFGPDGSENEYDLKLDRAFWTEGLR